MDASGYDLWKIDVWNMLKSISHGMNEYPFQLI
jgi:hypothetical protein